MLLSFELIIYKFTIFVIFLNLDLIKKTISDLNTIYIVSDDTFSSNAIKEQILNDIKNFDKTINVIFDNQIENLTNIISENLNKQNERIENLENIVKDLKEKIEDLYEMFLAKKHFESLSK